MIQAELADLKVLIDKCFVRIGAISTPKEVAHLQNGKRSDKANFDDATDNSPMKAYQLSAAAMKATSTPGALNPLKRSATGSQSLVQFDREGLEMLSQIKRAQLDANEMMRQKYLREVWRFEDLHKADEAPAYVHRIKGHEVKHI